MLPGQMQVRLKLYNSPSPFSKLTIPAGVLARIAPPASPVPKAMAAKKESGKPKAK
ncbi:hypothetical protein QN395_21525 [Undibacterium sp. RTI2.2]|uniref:hypothetical protein n=1 Tax=unclassified Undibacterium TaxID=2630295 RepID=UPI002AB568B3|nr:MULTISPECIES: hypothetical protein [unclassified Undibacterium]MDY7540705.1 hypothetical protein [Undibacterium sp. 5I1]MEB0119054.1 hypothetical protein [Undibacterium sp. RTI2.2]MEB0233030.1 hypothetical protein [Undibacterium sp. 10I3]MEB0259773.1 hypothetical protein [Undibacterium sp. 5I1]